MWSRIMIMLDPSEGGGEYSEGGTRFAPPPPWLRHCFFFFSNLFADFFKFFKCRLFNEYSRKPTENVKGQLDIRETAITQ